MAVWKCSALIKASTNNRKSGSWSESYYVNASSSDAARINFFDLILKRMAFCATGFSVRGMKFTNLNSPGESRTFSEVAGLVGALGTPDTPWQSLLCTCFTASGNKRELILPGVPDSFIINGAWAPGIFGAPLTNVFFTALVNGGWGLYGYDFTNPRVDVLSVDGNGAFVFSDTFLGSVSAAIKFFRTKDTLGKPVKGLFRIATLPTPVTGTLRFWKTDRVVEKGKVNIFTRSLKLFTNAQVDGITKRALGKDFFQFVGRRKVTR